MLYVRVSRDPANIGHAGKLIIGVDIEDIFYSQGRTEQVTASRVYDTLRLARGAGRLRRVQRHANQHVQARHLT